MNTTHKMNTTLQTMINHASFKHTGFNPSRFNLHGFHRPGFNRTLLAMALSMTCLWVHAETEAVKPSIPMLDVQFDCGDCKPDAKVKALIMGAYLDAADKQKSLVVDETSAPIPLRITSYRSRGKARLFVGMLAGADKITGVLSCNGQDTEVSDIAVSAINGIESVARNVGSDALRQVATCLGVKLEEPAAVGGQIPSGMMGKQPAVTNTHVGGAHD